jgi:lipopolysaccharide export system protein LptC
VSWRGILTLVLLVAAAVSGWSVWTHRPGRAAATPADARSDYLLHDFELVVLDKQGQEAFTLRAPQLERHPGDRTMSLATPVFTIPPAPNSKNGSWEVRSTTGWVSAEGDELRLRGDVVATNAGSDGEGPGGAVKMTTQELNVFPDARRATSAADVTITQPGSILRGHGMNALLDSKRIQLKSNVKGRYVPSGS